MLQIISGETTAPDGSATLVPHLPLKMGTKTTLMLLQRRDNQVVSRYVHVYPIFGNVGTKMGAELNEAFRLVYTPHDLLDNPPT